MKVDHQRAEARARHARQQAQREASTEEAAHRFQRLLQRRRKEEEAWQPGVAGPFELMARMRDRPDEPPLAWTPPLVQTQALSDGATAPAPDPAPWVDPESVRVQQQDSLRMDTIARAALEAGVRVAMAQGSGEYQVELGSALFTRTRLRVRAADNLGIEVRCESDSASEREWFAHHREALVERMAGLTGRTVHLDIADSGR